MKISIATVCISGNLQEKLEAIAAAGFRAVEIFENDLIAYPGSPRDVRRMCDEMGLKIVTCQPFRDFEGMPAHKRQRTLSARFVTYFFGSGVQHIALTTADIHATVSKMIANGVTMVPIPENYYDDLEARTDLSQDDIAALKALNILCDRDTAGTFYQAYTTTLDGGFFFEIVQRDSYAGYGAANASIRLAAQARLARSAAIPGDYEG